MSGMDGLALIQIMRGEHLLATTPVLMLTSVDHAGFAARLRQFRVNHYLTKPVTPTDFRDAILRALSGDSRFTPPKASGSRYGERIPPLRVLVAEDNPVNQRLVLRLLENMGHTAVAVGNGRQVLDEIEKVAQDGFSFDVILMDCQMPQMDGFEATKRIREYAPDLRSRIPIIALTAHALSGDRERCLEAGMDDYLSKPISANELASKLAAVSQLGGINRSLTVAAP
jgi:CheY-like chemotaxis protein